MAGAPFDDQRTAPLTALWPRPGVRRLIALAGAMLTASLAVASLGLAGFGPDSSIECLPARESLQHQRPAPPHGDLGQEDRRCWDLGRQRLRYLVGAVTACVALALLGLVAARTGGFAVVVAAELTLAFVLAVAWLLRFGT
jgi:hypothetical protein